MSRSARQGQRRSPSGVVQRRRGTLREPLFTDEEARCFILLRIHFDQLFTESDVRSTLHLWEQLGRNLHVLGEDQWPLRPAHALANKWRNIITAYTVHLNAQKNATDGGMPYKYEDILLLSSNIREDSKVSALLEGCLEQRKRVAATLATASRWLPSTDMGSLVSSVDTSSNSKPLHAKSSQVPPTKRSVRRDPPRTHKRSSSGSSVAEKGARGSTGASEFEGRSEGGAVSKEDDVASADDSSNCDSSGEESSDGDLGRSRHVRAKRRDSGITRLHRVSTPRERAAALAASQMEIYRSVNKRRRKADPCPLGAGSGQGLSTAGIGPAYGAFVAPLASSQRAGAGAGPSAGAGAGAGVGATGAGGGFRASSPGTSRGNVGLHGFTQSPLAARVRKAVYNVEVVDVHTHLFPPSFGSMMLFGIDQLLTYHYLVAELFSVLPLHSSQGGAAGSDDDITPDAFFESPVEHQADLVWKHLFVRRSPLSEACRGVLTTLNELGLGEHVASRDLAAIRKWFSKRDPSAHLEDVLRIAKVRSVVMTNVPFDSAETQFWDEQQPIPPSMIPVLRVDPLLSANLPAIYTALKKYGYTKTLAGLRLFLTDWIRRMKPLYLMASAPTGFKCDAVEIWEASTAIDRGDAPHDSAGRSEWTSTQLLAVLVQVALDNKLALAFKVGADRGVNPDLRAGGDAVEVAGLAWLGNMCREFPAMKFLVTVLSRENQHELAVLSRKFPNLHVYGCWWFCNTPSIISDVTQMRLELLGTSFTAQHSDARVLDQLIYKWKHSREVIAEVLIRQYEGLVATGWKVTDEEIHKDVHDLFGGSFEEFLGIRLSTPKS